MTFIFRLRESDRHFLFSLLIGIGVIFCWRGVWEGSMEIPVLDNVWVALFLGLIILTFSGIIFKEFDPFGGLEKSTLRIMHAIHHHPQRKKFTIFYHDRFKKKNIGMKASSIHNIEKNVISFRIQGKEVFIPVHRVRELQKSGKIIWRL